MGKHNKINTVSEFTELWPIIILRCYDCSATKGNRKELPLQIIATVEAIPCGCPLRANGCFFLPAKGLN
jgi:hypothetical protein